MEQRSSPSYRPKFTRNDEIEVAAVLLMLPSLIADGLRFSLSWGSKKRRSCSYETSFQSRVHLQSPPPVPSLHGIGFLLGSAFDPEKAAVKVEASSPATPLSFCPSESDEKPKRLKRKASVKKTKEEWLEIMEQYTQSNELLIKEIKQLRHYYEELKASNLWLQAKKQELSLGNVRGEKPHLELKTSLNLLEVKLGQSTVKASTVVGYEGHHLHLVVDQRSLIMDKTANKAGIAESYPFPYDQALSLLPSRSGLSMSMSMIKGDVGPNGIPDLNVSPIESVDFAQLVDDSRTLTKAMAAQARQRRMQICRDKNSNYGSKLRLSHR
ncbi:hypothetical protein P3X46_002020 [Hevea brasiliensis]|uniref:BZIP domain-containing protein n=1 Tax=Hevea brasiliensis TaxID=3981 RepID=A0ABQ9N3X7_HEVBR|nr:uncharacterized protein LOC110673835 [Hevea brasiliensis]KAJ9186448.1 hypothetical protein P3X46_002020 [Hevea brasiliensis]